MNLTEKKSPLLSVVVPVYGVEQYLCECIESILAQKYRNLEIILIDDGSKGNEGKICDRYAAIDTRIKVVHKVNEGLVAARKTGIGLASAEYITFVDGDDFIADDYYSQMMDIIIREKPDILAVSFSQYYSSERCEIIQQCMKSGVYEGERLTYLVENLNCMNEKWYEYSIFPSTCLKIYKTKKLRETAMTVPENIRLGEDSAFSFPYILLCKKIVVANNITGYYYRVVDASMARQRYAEQISEMDELYCYLKPFYENAQNTKLIRQLDIYRLYLINIMFSWMTRDVDVLSVHKTVGNIKNMVKSKEIFKDIDLNRFIVPETLGNKLLLVIKHRWLRFEYAWMKRCIKEKLHAVRRKDS